MIGVGHLISSIAIVLLFFATKEYFDPGAMTWIDWLAGRIALTLLLVAGVERLDHRLEHTQRTLTYVSAAIVAAMGVGFLTGWF